MHFYQTLQTEKKLARLSYFSNSLQKDAVKIMVSGFKKGQEEEGRAARQTACFSGSEKWCEVCGESLAAFHHFLFLVSSFA